MIILKTYRIKAIFVICEMLVGSISATLLSVIIIIIISLWDYNGVPRLCALSDFGTFMP